MANLNKEDAAARIGVSVRTLQRITKAGEIPVSYERGKKGDEARYDEADLLAYLEKTKPHALMRPAATPDATSDTALQRTDSPAEKGFRDGMMRAYNAMAAPVRLNEKMLLSLPEASQLSGVPVATLRAAAHEGTLKTVAIGRGLGKVRRADLEKYISKL